MGRRIKGDPFGAFSTPVGHEILIRELDAAEVSLAGAAEARDMAERAYTEAAGEHDRLKRAAAILMGDR